MLKLLLFFKFKKLIEKVTVFTQFTPVDITGVEPVFNIKKTIFFLAVMQKKQYDTYFNT